MRITWRTKTKDMVEIAADGIVHLTEYGDYTLCKKKLSEKGKWYILQDNESLDSANCKKCLKYSETYSNKSIDKLMLERDEVWKTLANS